MVGVAGCLRVLLNEVTAILGISYGKGRVAGRVERRINLHAAADIKVRRSGRKSIESGEEGRHDGVASPYGGGRRLKTDRLQLLHVPSFKGGLLKEPWPTDVFAANGDNRQKCTISRGR
jgi:hypothetical protein